MIPQHKKITYEEFLVMDKNSEERLEYMYGEVFLQASPTTSHQRILGEIFYEFRNFFKGKPCEPFISPFDVVFKNESGTHKVQPDAIVICDKSGLNEKNYTGVPTLVVEVLSSSTASRDLIKKMNLYMEFGVKEYWIVSPKNNSVQVFVLEDGLYNEPQMYKETGIVKSVIFDGMELNMEDIFNENV